MSVTGRPLALALDGCRLVEQCNNQITVDVGGGGGAMERRGNLGGMCGIMPCHCSGRRIDKQIIHTRMTTSQLNVKCNLEEKGGPLARTKKKKDGMKKRDKG